MPFLAVIGFDRSPPSSRPIADEGSLGTQIVDEQAGLMV